MVEDKFTKGFIAGFIGNVIKAGLDMFCFYVLHTVRIRYLDFSSFLVFGHFPHVWPEAVLAQIVELLFSGVLGVVFIYLLDIIGGRYIYFKSVVFSCAVWFTTYGLTKALRIIPFEHSHFLSAFSHLITSSAEGIVVALALVLLGHKTREASETRQG